MSTQCKLILVYGIVIALFLSNTCATNAKIATARFPGIVENITVRALEGGNYLENEDAHTLKSLKLNVSWVPPNGGKRPSSYSILITSVPKETDVHGTGCAENSVLYTAPNKSPFSVLVPQNELSNDMPEVSIRPNCTYKIQVYANPRARPVGKPLEVIYTVPECVGRACSCAAATAALPVPKWLLLVGAALCVIIGFTVVTIHNKNVHQLIWPSRSVRRQTMPQFAPYKSRWSELIFRKSSILYVEQRPEDLARCKVSDDSDEFEVPYKCINLLYKLGEGQFGIVYLGSLCLNNNKSGLVAVKMSQCSDASNEPKARRQLLEEIKIMKTAGSHRHLVGLIGCCTSPDNPICILLEYMEGGDLLAYLHSRRGIESSDASLSKENDLHGAIEKQQFMKFALDIAKGMEHLEGKRITHRDLAARNILLTSDLTLKISDFGLSRNGIYVINNTASKVRQLPIRWMSPEAIRDHAFSSKSDVWSFGIVLWEIGTLGSFPYASIQDDELMHYLIQDKCRLTCPNTISPDVYKIMCSCWNTAAQSRPSFAQLVLDLRTLKEPLHSKHETSNPCYTLLSH
ncbi:Fibroblast growth factor receptor [Ooceraea biroi]|uniref:Fibroblast growth factor receptor n=1 Tax=Ooceraea biroi TaxID=2015173 RepID=A0A026WSV1_OOCBI|nr:Fibroblast growth factor receptor [Ooceraea biroi]